MRRGASTYTYEWQVEGEGEKCDIYTFDINYSYTPGEPPTMFDSNGTGDPGSGPEIQIDEVMLVAAVVNDECVEVTLPLSQKWEAEFRKHMDSNWLDFYTYLAEDAEADMDGADDCWEKD